MIACNVKEVACGDDYHPTPQSPPSPSSTEHFSLFLLILWFYDNSTALIQSHCSHQHHFWMQRAAFSESK